MATDCPCCGANGREAGACGGCGHRWRGADPTLLDSYYAGLEGRNAGSAERRARRLEDRMTTFGPLLRDGMRVLEIGCAEGELGAQVKTRARIEYTGVELSRDASEAARVLDRVLPSLPREAKPYDLLLAFHVLEHIPDVATEVARWRQLLTPDGTAVVEVPRRAGHPLLSEDLNPEHLHQFTAASLAALFARSGLELVALTSGHFESALYPDSLRLVARPALSDAARRGALLTRFRSLFPGPFAIYGLGGDFRNYVLPLLADLQVAALLDSDAKRVGERIGPHAVAAFDASRHTGLPVLVASLRFGDEIAQRLIAAGVPRSAIIGLADLYGPGV